MDTKLHWTGAPSSGLSLYDEETLRDPFGSHSCPGGKLARLEMRALIEALLSRVHRFTLVDYEPFVNNVLHGPGRCVVEV